MNARWRRTAVLATGLASAWALAPSVAHGATIPVCSSGCAFSSIQAAVDAAGVGDVVLISPGVYRERVSIGFRGSDAEPRIKDITLRGAGARPGDTVISGDPEGDGIHDDTDADPVIYASSDPPDQLRFTLENLLVSGGATGVSLWGGDEASAATFAVRNVILTGNRKGLTAHPSGRLALELSNLLVTGNAPWGGINLSEGHRAGSHLSARVVNCTIVGNRLHYGGGAGLSIGGDVEVAIVNSIVWGNTAPYTPDLLVGPRTPAGAVTASHSDIGEVYTIEGSYVPGPGVVNANPVFVNAAAGDLRLHAGSPLRDAGVSEGAPGFDVGGQPRPEGAGWDIGADEYEPSPVARLIVLAPNGGERLAAGRPTAVTWDAPSDLASFRVHYSLDDGVTWVPVNRTPLPAGSRHILWTPPALRRTRTACRIRVSALKGSTLVRDSSDAPFSLELVRLVEPNGDEICRLERHSDVERPAGSTLLGWERYATTRELAKVRLSYSLDSGVSWKTIATFGPAGSLWEWSVPPGVRDGMTGLVRVQLLDPRGRVIAADRSDRPIRFLEQTLY